MTSEYFSNASGKRVLVIGDAVVDKYIFGVTTRVRPESPVPIIDVNTISSYVGHLGVVIKYILGFGGEALICSVVGDDFEGSFFQSEMAKLNCVQDGLFCEDMKTPQITRVKSWEQHVLQIENRYEFSHVLRSKVNKRMLDYVKEVINDVDIILLIDLDIGIFNQNHIFINNLMNLSKRNDKKVVVLPDSVNYQLFTEGYLMEMNLNNAASILGISQINDTSIRIIGNKILNDTHFDGLYLSSLYNNSYYLAGDGITLIPNIVQQPVVGIAGFVDAEISTLALLSAAGAPPEQAVKIANCAGALSTTKPNITYYPIDELQEACERGEVIR